MRLRRRMQMLAQGFDPLPAHRGYREHRAAGKRGAGEQRCRSRSTSISARGVDAVGLGQRDRAACDAEQVEDAEVLARLRHHAVVGGDHQQREVDAGRAGEHVLDEALVAGHVDEADHARRRAAAR